MTEHYGSQHFASQHFGSDHFSAGEGSGTTYADMAMVATATAVGFMDLAGGESLGGHVGGAGGGGFKRRRKTRWEDETLAELQAAYAELAGERPTREAAAELVELVAPFAPAAVVLPPVSAIDWGALVQSIRSAEMAAAIAEAQRRMDEEDEDLIMLLAA